MPSPLLTILSRKSRFLHLPLAYLKTEHLRKKFTLVDAIKCMVHSSLFVYIQSSTIIYSR